MLHGHDSEITCVAIATELDIAVSGAKVRDDDGMTRTWSILLANLRRVS